VTVEKIIQKVMKQNTERKTKREKHRSEKHGWLDDNTFESGFDKTKRHVSNEQNMSKMIHHLFIDVFHTLGTSLLSVSLHLVRSKAPWPTQHIPHLSKKYRHPPTRRHCSSSSQRFDSKSVLRTRPVYALRDFYFSKGVTSFYYNFP
jgi:hypothetical protein